MPNASEIVIETIVKAISFEPRNAASALGSPRSMCRCFFAAIVVMIGTPGKCSAAQRSF